MSHKLQFVVEYDRCQPVAPSLTATLFPSDGMMTKELSGLLHFGRLHSPRYGSKNTIRSFMPLARTAMHFHTALNAGSKTPRVRFSQISRAKFLSRESAIVVPDERSRKKTGPQGHGPYPSCVFMLITLKKSSATALN